MNEVEVLQDELQAQQAQLKQAEVAAAVADDAELVRAGGLVAALRARVDNVTRRLAEAQQQEADQAAKRAERDQRGEHQRAVKEHQAAVDQAAVAWEAWHTELLALVQRWPELHLQVAGLRNAQRRLEQQAAALGLESPGGRWGALAPDIANCRARGGLLWPRW